MVTPIFLEQNVMCFSDIRYRWYTLVSNEVLMPKIGIAMRYRKVTIPELGIEIKYQKVLIPEEVSKSIDT